MTQKRRYSIRLSGYDYSQNGAYFLTVCTHNRECLFGQVVSGEMWLNTYGNIVHEEWLRTSAVRAWVVLDAFAVMPNHFHGIVILEGDTVGANRRFAPATSHPHGAQSGSIGAIMQQFKSLVTKRINTLRDTPQGRIWQRNYYDRIIRNERGLNAFRQYIYTNPQPWTSDRENPLNARL